MAVVRLPICRRIWQSILFRNIRHRRRCLPHPPQRRPWHRLRRRSFHTQQNVQNGVLPCITLDPALENKIAGGVQRTEHGSYVSLDPDSMQKLLTALQEELKKLTDQGYQPIVLTSPTVRPYFRNLVERSIAGLIVLSHAEIEQNVEIQILGVVRI